MPGWPGHLHAYFAITGCVRTGYLRSIWSISKWRLERYKVDLFQQEFVVNLLHDKLWVFRTQSLLTPVFKAEPLWSELHTRLLLLCKRIIIWKRGRCWCRQEHIVQLCATFPMGGWTVKGKAPLFGLHRIDLFAGLVHVQGLCSLKRNYGRWFDRVWLHSPLGWQQWYWTLLTEGDKGYTWLTWLVRREGTSTDWTRSPSQTCKREDSGRALGWQI